MKFQVWHLVTKVRALRKCCSGKPTLPEKAKKFEDIFNTSIIRESVFESLDILTSNRNDLIHYNFSFDEVRRRGKTALDCAIVAIIKLAKNRFSPRIIQISSKEFDIYGRRFYFGEDEQGKIERIVSSMTLEVGELYLVFPLAKPERIEPIIFPYIIDKKYKTDFKRKMSKLQNHKNFFPRSQIIILFFSQYSKCVKKYDRWKM